MNRAHLTILKGAITQIESGKTLQMQYHDGKWNDILNISALGIAVANNNAIRVKPEPVFKECAFFKLKGKKEIAVVGKDYIFLFPEKWVRISDWVKVEIKDDIS